MEIDKNPKQYIIINIILIILCLSLSILGMRYKNNNIETETQKKEIKTNAITNLTNEEKNHINNIVISIFNDCRDKITFNKNEIVLSEEAKIISAAKVMYLEGNLNTTKPITKEEKNKVLKTAYELYNSNIQYKDFKINYSNEYCGVGGYNSLTGLEKEHSKKASGKCKEPFIIFETKEIKLSGEDEYTAIVYLAFPTQEDISGDQKCSDGKKSYTKLIKAYSDSGLNNNLYSSKVAGCCIAEECETAAIYNEKDKIMNIITESDNYYKVTFKKKNNIFKLEHIKKSK